MTTIVAALVATLLLFGLVGFQALIVGTQSTLDDLEAQIASEERENQRLRLEVAELDCFLKGKNSVCNRIVTQTPN
ncbi:MAG: hypothetical protein AAF480_06090, partial [Actinomycetota bacterium]